MTTSMIKQTYNGNTYQFPEEELERFEYLVRKIEVGKSDPIFDEMERGYTIMLESTFERYKV